jgi:hypothetical protein
LFDLLETYFWWLDLAVAISVTLVAGVACRFWSRGRSIHRLFWLGVAVGLTWEVPIFLSAVFAETPVIVLHSQPPVPPITLIVFHSLWDGGLFLGGVALVWALGPRPIFARFSVRELVVLLLWGQVSEFAVEIGGVTNDAWGYVGTHAWNPVLFHIQDHPITLVPQLIWFAAPIVYYLLALRLENRRRK